MQLRQIKQSEKVDEVNVCAYCGDLQRGFSGCCGEVHYEPCYKLADGEWLNESDCEVVDD